MDQEELIIDLSAVTNHYNSFCSEQTCFIQGFNSFRASSINSTGNPQVSSMFLNLDSRYTLLNGGYSNIDRWWSDFNTRMREIDSSVVTSVNEVSDYHMGFYHAFSPMASPPAESTPLVVEEPLEVQAIIHEERQQLRNMGFPPEILDQGFSVEIVSALRIRNFTSADLLRLSRQEITGNQIHTLVFQRGYQRGEIIDLVAREYLTPRSITEILNLNLSYYQVMSRNQEGSAWSSFVRIYHERYPKPWEQTDDEVVAIHDATMILNFQQDLLDETKEYLQIAKLLCGYVQELSNQHRWGIFYPDGGAHRRFWIDDDPSNLNWDLINQELEEIERNIMLSDGADSELIRFWFEDRHWHLNLDILDRPFSEIFEEMGVSNLSEFREWILKEETAVAELEFLVFDNQKTINQMPYVNLYLRIQDLELTDHTDTVDSEYRPFLDYRQTHIYNYLYINYGPDEAANYFEVIRDDLRQFRGALAAAEFMSNLNNMHCAVQFVYMFGTGTVDGVINWGQGIANFFNPSTERSVRDYEKMFIMQQLMAQTVPQEIQVLMANGDLSEEEFAIQIRNHIIREIAPGIELTDEDINTLFEDDRIEEYFAGIIEDNDLYGMTQEDFSQIMSAENWNRVLSNTYSFGVTFGNIVPSMVATVATKGIAAKAFPHMSAAQLAKFAATTSSMFFMFPSITGNETSRALIDGAEFWQARLYGVLRGLSETTLQRMLGNIPGINPNAKYAFTGFIRQGLIEGAMQEVVASTLRCIIYGEPMNLSSEDLTKAFFMGFLLSAFTTGGQAVIHWGTGVITGEVVVTSDTLIRIANASPNMDAMVANFEAYLNNQVLNNQASEVNTDLTLEQFQLNAQEIIDQALIRIQNGETISNMLFRAENVNNTSFETDMTNLSNRLNTLVNNNNTSLDTQSAAILQDYFNQMFETRPLSSDSFLVFNKMLTLFETNPNFRITADNATTAFQHSAGVFQPGYNYIYLTPSYVASLTLALNTITHEFGHAFDFYHGNTEITNDTFNYASRTSSIFEIARGLESVFSFNPETLNNNPFIQDLTSMESLFGSPTMVEIIQQAFPVRAAEVQTEILSMLQNMDSAQIEAFKNSDAMSDILPFMDTVPTVKEIFDGLTNIQNMTETEIFNSRLFKYLFRQQFSTEAAVIDNAIQNSPHYRARGYVQDIVDAILLGRGLDSAILTSGHGRAYYNNDFDISQASYDLVTHQRVQSDFSKLLTDNPNLIESLRSVTSNEFVDVLSRAVNGEITNLTQDVPIELTQQYWELMRNNESIVTQFKDAGVHGYIFDYIFDRGQMKIPSEIFANYMLLKAMNYTDMIDSLRLATSDAFVAELDRVFYLVMGSD